jgi:hypothetical protein
MLDRIQLAALRGSPSPARTAAAMAVLQPHGEEAEASAADHEAVEATSPAGPDGQALQEPRDDGTDKTSFAQGSPSGEPEPDHKALEDGTKEATLSLAATMEALATVDAATPTAAAEAAESAAQAAAAKAPSASQPAAAAAASVPPKSPSPAQVPEAGSTALLAPGTPISTDLVAEDGYGVLQ